MRTFSLFKTEVSGFLPIFLPILLSQYAQTANGIIDTVMTARLGAVELGGVAMGVALWMPVYYFVIGILFGTLIMIAQYFGAGDREKVRHTAWQGIWMGLGLGGAAALVVWLICPVLGIFSPDAPLVRTAQGYVRMVVTGFPLGAAAIAIRFYCEGQKAIYPVTFMAVLVVCCNAFLNYILMFGHFGFPALGARGCGLATSISMGMFFIIVTGYTAFSKRFQGSRLLTHIPLPRAGALKQMFRLGAPIGLGFTNEYLVLSVITLCIGSRGALPVSAHQAAFSCYMLFFTIPGAISFAASIRIGNLMGAGVPDKLVHAATSILAFGGLMGGSISFLVYVKAAPLAVMMAEDPAIAGIATGMIRISAFFLLADTIQICCSGILRGAGDTAIPFAITAGAYWLVSIPLGYLLSGMPLPLGQSVSPELFGPRGWWYGLTIGIIMAAVLLCCRVNRILLLSGSGKKE